MELKKIDQRLARLSLIVESWREKDCVSHIERDMALEELRRIYDAILDYSVSRGATHPTVIDRPEPKPENSTPDREPVVEQHAESEHTESSSVVVDFDDALDIDALLGIGTAATVEPQPAEVEVSPIAEPIAEPIVEQVEKAHDEVVVTPEPNDEPKSTSLFDLDDIPVRAKSGRRMVKLYNDDYSGQTSVHREEIVAPKPEPKPEPKPIQIPKTEPKPQYTPLEAVVAPQSVAEAVAESDMVRIGDILGGNITTVGDKMASDDAPTTPFNKIASLREAIGINDKFQMIRDLFSGDASRYEATIDTLDEFDDLDECMIYIVENFRWNPDTEGAKLLVSLIERKLA
ncbi:MAG: hypothetical protein E7146_04365 [Rikenellaceae bacterium]|nr:hypothetical protein [Rikenellaceae bacterium]